MFGRKQEQQPHLGGLAVGLLAGVLLGHPVEAAAAARRPVRTLTLAVAGAAVLAGGIAAVPRAVAGEDVLLQAAALEERANDTLARMQRQEISGDRFAEVLEGEVLPAWRVVRQDLEAFAGQRGVDRQRVAALTELLRVQEELYELWVAALRADDDGHWPALHKKQRELEEMAARMKSSLPD